LETGRRPPPAVPAPALLTVLPPGDLSSLGHGLLKFLERLGPRPARHPGGAGLWPWVAAVVTAAAATGAACEIARRERARPAVAPDRVPGHPFEG
jgi:hypothetical protein